MVNGTRGKSSVTRLIAAGLREAGIRTLAKITGTMAAIIYPDGSEKPINRLSKQANIIEQVLVFKEAAECRVEAVVVECMALRQDLQKISQDMLVKSNIGVLTNIRPDHLDVMGPTIRHVADAILNTVPKKGKLLTAESEFIDTIRKKAVVLDTEVIQSVATRITNEMMSGFTYLEHKENVALAIDTCAIFGIDAGVALRGMYKLRPDLGVLRTFKIYEGNKYIEFINALATNDPLSLLSIWQRMLKKISEEQLKIMLVVSRQDRYSRSQQLMELVAQELPTDYCFLVGETTNRLASSLISHGFNQDKIINFGITTPAAVYEKVMLLTAKDSVVFAIGNIADSHNLGMGIIEYFKERSKK